MPQITAFFTNNNVPLTSPGTVPTISIWRLDTQAAVEVDEDMTEVDDGLFVYDFAESELDYGFVCDGDPTGGGVQVTPQERYVAGSFSGITEARIETDIPAILTDTDTTIPALVQYIIDLLEATSEVDQSTDPWTEKWIRQSDLTTLITFQLYDENLAAINNTNPMSNKRVRRRLKM